MVQTRAQAKSSGVNVAEVHGANKGLIPHVKPKKSMMTPAAHLIPPTCHLRPVHHPPSTDQRLPTNAVPPLPKPRIGQGRAGIIRKAKVTLPIPKSIQTPTPPIAKPAPRTVATIDWACNPIMGQYSTTASCANNTTATVSWNYSKLASLNP